MENWTFLNQLSFEVELPHFFIWSERTFFQSKINKEKGTTKNKNKQKKNYLLQKQETL